MNHPLITISRPIRLRTISFEGQSGEGGPSGASSGDEEGFALVETLPA
jgi:hypothetical protein